jgi:hypothetical protein
MQIGGGSRFFRPSSSRRTLASDEGSSSCMGPSLRSRTTMKKRRHCEERSDVAIQIVKKQKTGSSEDDKNAIDHRYMTCYMYNN